MIVCWEELFATAIEEGDSTAPVSDKPTTRPSDRRLSEEEPQGGGVLSESAQYIKEGKNAIKWTRLSCRKFRNNEVRLQLQALAYNLGNFMRTLALPKEVEHWSLTTLREKLVKIGAKVVRIGRYVTFQMLSYEPTNWVETRKKK